MISRAGSNGSRRRHDSLSGKRVTFGWIEGVISGRVVVLLASAVPCWGQPWAACEAMPWQFFRAASTDALPAITAENCWVHWLPTSWNSGTPTYWTPGRPGRLVVPGLSIGALDIASSVGSANALASFLYWGISYVDLRVPGGIAAQPPAIALPASLM